MNACLDPNPILLVEDNNADARLLREYLSDVSATTELVHCERLNEALQRIVGTPFQAVLLDLSLPDSQGIETLTRVLERAPHTPVIVLTGNEDAEIAIKAVQMGAQDYLNKGELEGDLLLRTLLYAIERHGILERMKQFDRQKTEFLNTASHEMRTPLTIIREYVALTLDGFGGPLSPQQADFLGAVVRNCDRLMELLNDLLDLSKLTTANVHIRRRLTDMTALLTNCYNDFVPRCKSKQQCLTLELPESIPPVYCDPDKITQALVNLIGNAHKFTPEGGQIRIGVRNRGDALAIDVQDNGPGIRAEDQERIFKQFVQVDREDGPGPKGTGLGLAITHRIAQIHGGAITLESDPAIGSRFTLELPVQSEDAPLVSFIADRWRAATNRERPASLVALRLPVETNRVAGRRADLTLLYDIARSVLRPEDSGTVSEDEEFLILVVEADGRGVSAALARLRAALPERLSRLTIEMAVKEMAPDRTCEEWLGSVRKAFQPMPMEGPITL